jgi:hypothetical protein
MEHIEGGSQATGEVGPPKYPGATLNLGKDDSGKTHHVKAGDVVAVSLVGVPTAGYIWFEWKNNVAALISFLKGSLLAFTRESRLSRLYRVGWSDDDGIIVMGSVHRRNTHEPAQAWLDGRQPLGSTCFSI